MRECGGADSAGVCFFLQASRCLPACGSWRPKRAFPKVPCSWGSAYELGAVQFFYVGEIRGRSSMETSFSSPLGCFCCRVTSSRWRPPCSSICVRFLEVSGRFRQLWCRRWRHFALQCWWPLWWLPDPVAFLSPWCLNSGVFREPVPGAPLRSDYFRPYSDFEII